MEEENKDEKLIDIIFVGFRVYEEEGAKEDTDGRKFNGWSSKYDEWKSTNDIQVQRYNTICKYYKAAGRFSM